MNTNVGTNGYVWSSSSNYAGSNNAGNLNFNSGNVNPLNNTNRANGFSVRCVQASAAAFFPTTPRHEKAVPDHTGTAAESAQLRLCYFDSSARAAAAF